MSRASAAAARQAADLPRSRRYTPEQQAAGVELAARQVELEQEDRDFRDRLSRRRDARDRALRLGKKSKLSTRDMEAFIEAEGGELDHSRIARIVASETSRDPLQRDESK